MSRITDDIFKQMTEEEKHELMCRNAIGTIYNDENGRPYMIVRGFTAFERIREYEDLLISKYGKK
jgi:hypothetical protein